MTKLINYRRRGGIRFLTIGRLSVSWSVRRYRPTDARAIEDVWGVSPCPNTVVDHLYTSYID